MLPRQLALAGKRWIAGCDFRVVPKELQNWQRPLLWEEATVAQEPRAVRIFESVDGVTKNGSVTRIQNWIFVVTFARGRPIGEQLVEVSVSNIAKHGVVVRGIYPSLRALYFSEQGQAGPCDPHVIHGFVIATFGRDHIRCLQNVDQALLHLHTPRTATIVAASEALECRGDERR